MLKKLEIVAKLLLARLLAALFWRPGRARRAAARLRAPVGKVLVVRTDERVGEALLTTPLLTALKRLRPAPEVHLLVHPRVVRVLAGHPEVDRLIPFSPRDRNLGPLSGVMRALRRERYDLVVNAANWESPSVGPAVVARLCAHAGIALGPSVGPVGALMDAPVLALTDTRSEARQRLHLLSPLGLRAGAAPLSFRPVAVDAVVEQALAACGGRPMAVVNPGGRVGWRRVRPEVFAAAARALGARGLVPLVTWGPGEEELAEAVVGAAPGAVRAPATSIDQLAALMQRARLTVCNNTGPMHLSVAVGTRTVAFFLHMDMARWGHAHPPHQMVDLTPLSEAERPGAAALAVDLATKSP